MNSAMRMMTVNDSIGHDSINHFTGKKYDVIGRAQNQKEATQLLSELQPDVVTIDLSDTDESGLSCIDQMVEAKPDVKILVLCSAKNQVVGIKSLIRGANSFLQRPFNQEQLSRALKTASTGLVL
ncbi:MAG: response regulator [Arenicella sp.]